MEKEKKCQIMKDRAPEVSGTLLILRKDKTKYPNNGANKSSFMRTKF